MSRKRPREIRQSRTIMNNGHTEYMDVDLRPLFKTARGIRADPVQESTVIQRNLNDKNSKRLFYQKACHNFRPGDLLLTLPYKDRFLPPSWERAEREAYNFIRRYNDLRKKLGLASAKYMLVTEYTTRKSGRHKGTLNFHHHLLVSGGVDRDTVEGLWRRPRRKGQEEGELIGHASSKSLHFDENGIEGLMVYFFGEEKQATQLEVGAARPKHKRRWKGSKNLAKPKIPKPNDTRWSDSKVSRLAEEIHRTEQTDPLYWEQQYPGYRFSKCTVEYNEVTRRWSIYLRFHRRM